MQDYENPASGFDIGANSPITLSAANNQLAAPSMDLSSTASAAAVPNVQVPGAGGQAAGGPNMFQEGGAFQVGLGAIKTLGSLWNSFQQTKLAKKSLSLQTRSFETNLANQTKSYNTALEDRINARYAAEGKDQAGAQSYIDKNKL